MLKVTYRYWNLMAPLLVRSLKRQYGKQFASEAARNGKKLYRKMLEEAPDVGSDNPMAHNLYQSLVMLALYEGSGRRITEEGMRQMVSDVMHIPVLKLMGLSIDYRKARGVQKENRQFHTCAEWIEQHPQYREASWDFNFDDTRHRDGTYYWFTHCPIEQYCRSHDLIHILPVLCDIDYMIADLAHAKLVRHETLAKGGKVCDYWLYSKDLTEPK